MTNSNMVIETVFAGQIFIAVRTVEASQLFLKNVISVYFFPL